MRRVTGAVVLMGVAVSAVTGCVTVRGEVEPHRSPDVGTTLREGPADGAGDTAGAQPRTARPSAREALSRPERPPSGTGTPDGPGKNAAPEGDAAPQHATESEVPGGIEAPRRGRKAPLMRSPAAPELPDGPEICDLGRRYGGWAEGSIPERTCERAYDG